MPDAAAASLAASVLRGTKAALASAAAADLLEANAGIASRYGDRAVALWKGEFESRIDALATALSLGRAEIFASGIAWSRIAFEARGIDPAEIRLGLDALRRVIEQELPGEAAVAAGACLQAGSAGAAAAASAPVGGLDPRDDRTRLATAYLAALLGGDAEEAASLVLDAAGRTADVRSLYRDVLVPAQREIGRLWHIGEVSVAVEHFVTASTDRVMARLLPLHPRPPSRGRTVVAAGVGGNAHAIGLRMIADFFAMDGWRPVYLGTDVPRVDLVESLHEFRADLLALSATLPSQIEETRRVIDGIRADARIRSLPVLAGGAAFEALPGLASEIGADGTTVDPDEAVALGNRLVAGR